MTSYEYHQLLKFIYFEGYANSYEDAEYLLEEFDDDEYEELCEKFVKAMDTRRRGPDHRTRFPEFTGRDDEFDPKFTRKRVRVKQDGEDIDPYFRGRNRRKTERRQGVGGRSFSEAKVDDGLTSQQKEIMRNHRLTPGDRLPVRGETPTDTHNRLTNTRRRRTSDGRGARGVRGSKVPEFSIKTIRTPDQIRNRLSQLRTSQTRNNIVPFNREDYEYIISYLINEGYSDSYDCAEVIFENMSDEWLNVILEEPFQIYGPDPHGPSDAEPIPLGKPYKNKKRAKTRANNLDQEIGGYRHFVRKVDEEFKDLTPDKEKRVQKRLDDLKNR
jgi:hypothetical protein